MIKQSEKYLHQETGIAVEVCCDYDYSSVDIKWNVASQVLEIPNTVRKKVRLRSNHNDGLFVFNKSKPEMIKRIGDALCEIASFVEKL